MKRPGIEQFRIEIFLTRLLLFRAPVVVHREEHITGARTGRPQVDRRFSAIAADLEARAQPGRRLRQLEQGAALLRIEKALDPACQLVDVRQE